MNWRALHSITSSAGESSCGGTVRPSIVAVWALMASLNFGWRTTDPPPRFNSFCQERTHALQQIARMTYRAGKENSLAEITNFEPGKSLNGRAGTKFRTLQQMRGIACARAAV
jgi:hypothetical protein